MKTVFFLQSSHCQSNRAELAGAIRAAKSYGWTIRVIEYAAAATDRKQHATDDAGFWGEYRRMRDFWSPIGVIVDCGAAPDEFKGNAFRPLPTVFLDRPSAPAGAKTACVFSDAEAIARLAARELLALNYPSYAYAPFTDNLAWSLNRGRSFAAALKLNHLKCHVFRKERRRVEDATYFAELERWLRELPKPVAIFAANDYIGELTISAAVKCGLRVPDDVAVLGVDDDEDICLRTTPSLSSIKPDHEKAGYLAATLLKDLIAGTRSTPRAQTFGPLAVFHRGSTRALQRKDNRIARILESIRENATSGITVAQLVKGLKVSRRLIEMRFRETTGKSILEEIQAVRLERAKVMLTQSRLPMDEVARSSGFSSAQALRKALLKATGKTPVAWRKQHLR